MTDKQLKILSKMKKLINCGQRKFSNRSDRNYIQCLLDIGITEEDAWNEILTLSKYNYVYDYKPFYSKKNDDALIFKKIINGYKVYIKLIIENNDNIELTVCLSFHKDFE